MNSFYGAVSLTDGCLSPESISQNKLYESEDYIFWGDLRLDNREELVGKLGLLQDTEDYLLVVEAYRSWSEGCVERLLGDFAFVIWDKKCRTVFCARDHIGVRPLFYSYNKGVFAFASDKKLLFSTPGFQKKANYKRISEILSCGVIGTLEYSNETEYLNVFQLTPAHSLTIQSGNLKFKKYWDLSVREEVRKLSLDDAVDGLRSHLDEAVRCRVPSSGNVGAELSGGLDSSMVTALAAKYRPDMHIFCSYIDKHNEVFLNERPYVESLCDFFNIKNRHFVSSEGFEFRKELEECVRAIDGFGYGLGNLFKAPLIEKALEVKCDIIFSGFGGDECVSYSGTSLRKGTGVKENLKFILQVYAPSFLRKYREFKYPDSSRVPLVVIKQPNLLKLSDTLPKSYQSYSAMMSRSKERGDVDHLIEGITGKRSEYVRSAVSSMSIYSKNVTYVFPLLDVRLLEFMISIPNQYRNHEGVNRYLMRRAGEGIIPEDLRLRRDKAGFIFPAPYYEYLRYFEEQTGKSSPILSRGQVHSLEQKREYYYNHLERGSFLFNSACDIFFDLL